MLGAGANRNQQWGTGNQGRGRGDKKSEWHMCSKPAPRCKGGTASRWRACNPPNPHPPPQTPQTVCRGAVYPLHREKTGTVRRKPAIPPHRAPTQPLSPAANRRMRNKKLRKNREMQQKRRILRHNCALCAQRIIKRAVRVYKSDRCQKENSE